MGTQKSRSWERESRADERKIQDTVHETKGECDGPMRSKSISVTTRTETYNSFKLEQLEENVAEPE